MAMARAAAIVSPLTMTMSDSGGSADTAPSGEGDGFSLSERNVVVVGVTPGWASVHRSRHSAPLQAWRDWLPAPVSIASHEAEVPYRLRSRRRDPPALVPKPGHINRQREACYRVWSKRPCKYLNMGLQRCHRLWVQHSNMPVPICD